jgi:serine/threonine protein kinase/tetratricopeptide (TPR) repeat protein
MTCPSCSADNEPGIEVCFRCGRHLTALTQGAVIASRYEIVSLLGAGGMGRVYKAKDRLLDEVVAIKVLRSELGTPEMAQRFRAELKLARKVSHPNVCRIHEYGEEGTTRFISMALIEGTDLGKLMRRHPAGLPADEALRIALQVADGLQAIHDAGIIHRDLKAQNIVVDEAGVVRLMDFGIAKDSSMVRGMTATGQVIGTPEYMSPEQCRGGPLDSRSDVYSLAVVIYEIFTGRVPFLGESITATLLMQIQEPPPLDGEVASRLPPGLPEVLLKAMAKDPAERFASAAEVAAALREIRQRPARPAPAAPAPAPPPPHDRRRHSRLGISVDVMLKRTGTDGDALQHERTVADNIGKSGARVMTSMTGLSAGDTVHLQEVGGEFETRAAIRHVFTGPDRIQRLGLEFLDRPAPDRLAPSAEPRRLTRPDAAVRKTPPPSEERRRDSRFEVTLDVVLAWPGPDGQRDERTIADNIGQSGARVMTTLPVALGDSVSIREVGGDFHTRAVVRSVRSEGRDVRRLGLEFLDRRAPARLVPGGDATDRHPRPSTPAPGPQPAEAEERRQRILTAYQALPSQDHFAVLGLTRAASAAAVKEAYVRLCKLFHPDAQAHPAISDLRPQSEAVFLRLKEAYEVLADPEQRARYDSRLGRPASTPPSVPATPATPAPPMDEETLALKAAVVVRQAKKLMAEEKYWDAIQVLEAALETTGGHKASQTIRILLARATSKNPKWLKRAADTLQSVISEEPGSVDAHFELGVVYKAAGLKSRARAELRRTLELDPGHAAAAAELRLLDGDQDEPNG